MGRARGTSSGGTAIPRGSLAALRPLAAALLLAVPTAAAAQEAVAKAVDLKRLQFEYKCAFEAFRGKAETGFLGRLRSQRVAFEREKKPDLGAMEDLLARALWARCQHFRGAKDDEQASPFAEEIGRLEKTTSAPEIVKIKDEADTFVIGYNLDRAEAEEKKGNLTVAFGKFRACTSTPKEAPLARAVEGLVRISKQNHDYDAVVAAGDIEATAEMQEAVMRELEVAAGAKVYGSHPGFKGLKDDFARTEGKRGYVDLEVRDFNLGGYKLAVADLDLKTAMFSFQPVSEGDPWPLKGDSAVLPRVPLALMAGTYDVRVYLPAAGPEPVAVYLRVATGKKEAAPRIVVPAKIPEGMVFLGPWQGGGGFFIDRTEVTVAQVDAAKGGDATLATVVSDSSQAFNNPQCPAWFAEEDQVAAWAAATGKSVPTIEQWIQAARGPFATGERPYPWGTETPRPGDHFYSNPNGESPKPAGAASRLGRSPFGLDDMAGNMCEWVAARDGGLWVLGGHYQMKPEVLFSGGEGGKSYLWEPAPGPKAFKALPNQGAYSKHNYGGINPEGPTSGLRMVVNVR